MAPSGQLDQHRVGGLETAVTMVELDICSTARRFE
jgi:hypothetical protein